MLGAAMEVITQFPSLVRLDRCLYISGTNLKANLRSSRCDAIARDCRTVRQLRARVRGELLVLLQTSCFRVLASALQRYQASRAVHASARKYNQLFPRTGIL